ncbi:MAG: serine/threonine-protein kinase, partial [Geminicoccales bacterium]
MTGQPPSRADKTASSGATDETRAGAADETRAGAADDASAPTFHRPESEAATIARPASRSAQDWSHPEDWVETHSGPLQTGSVIKERFVLQALIGKGGMGVVYGARDLRKEEAQDRDPYVAIKLLGEDFSRHPDSLKALQREARKSQQLAHPNIVTVFDFDRDGTTIYMTMELLKGKPLEKVIRQHPEGLPVAQALRIADQMASGLAYAHEKNIVHSDFKPGNVFLEPGDRAKVLDFGIARAVQARGFDAGDQTVFDAGQLGALTPSYASREMLNGEPPAASDDVYALALVVYELFTGRHPYDRKHANQAKLEGLRPRPVPGLKRRQWKALARGLELDREKRPADAAEFMRALRGPTPLKRSIVAVIALLAISSAGLAWRNLTQDETAPDIPFSQLPAQTREEFYSQMEQGDTALELGLYNEALFYYGEAYRLHERNPEAEKRLEQVADLVIASAPQSGDRAGLQTYLRDIDNLMK